MFFNKEGVVFQEIVKQKSKCYIVRLQTGRNNEKRTEILLCAKGNKGTFQLNMQDESPEREDHKIPNSKHIRKYTHQGKRLSSIGC